MKAKFSSFIHFLRNRGKKDIFESTQFRLTLLYSGLLMLFLLLFTVVVYSLLYATIFQNQERELESRVNQEARSIEDYLMHNNRRNLSGIQNQELVIKDVDQFFFYIVNPNGELVLGDESIPELRSDLLGIIQGWTPTRNEIRKESLKVDFSEQRPKGKEENNEFHPTQKTDNIRLIISGHPIYYYGENIGMLYIGKDISFAYQLFKWLLIILSGLAILFSGVALIISYFMSKKAMIPITRAFSRQREFVADASHELRTPLSVMLSSINAMEMTLDLKEEDYSHKLLFNMKDEVKRMTKLVGDLLTLARSDSGTLEHVNEIFDCRQAAEQAIESVRALAGSKKIKLHFHAPELLIVHGDPQRFTQLLYILLDNAIKYTPNGGEASLSLAVEAHELLITMNDTGIGIKPEDYDRIFERFYRSDKSRTRQIGGHGLGLAIAKWIVESQGGTIQVSSEIGKGSTFSIRIPIRGLR